MAPNPGREISRRATDQARDRETTAGSLDLGGQGFITGVLLVLTVAFLGRVLAQLTLAFGDVGFLPAFDAGLATSVDDRLRATNVEYSSKRASGRLDSIIGIDLGPGCGERYRANLVAGGQRDAQFKYLPLQYFDQCPFFAEHGDPADDDVEGGDR